MKITLAFLLIFTSSICKAQTVYFYANNLTGLIAKIKIFQDDNPVAELRKNEWIKIKLENKKNITYKIKCANYFSNKTINLNFNTDKVAFVKVHLGEMGWEVYEQSYPNIPSVVWNEYAAQYNDNIIKDRLANHPKTDWTESTLKNKFVDKVDANEGIYENSFSSENSPRYKLGVIKVKNAYNLIYLSGGDEKYWSEGDIKAILIETATPNFYKTIWYMADKGQNDEVFISFDQGKFTSIFGDGNKNLHIKLFPTASESDKSNVIGSGTGFAISESGLIVTNHHVIEGAKEINIKGVNGDFDRSYSAQVLIEDKINDLAILKINDPIFKSIQSIPYEINLKVIDVGSSVFALGYPLRSTMGDNVKLTNGIISSKSGFQDDITAYQISVPIQPGNSGGPLFDNNGNVVGIINAKHTNTDNVSYAIKTLYLYNLILSLDEPPSELKSNIIKSKSLMEQVKSVENFVYIIEVI